MEPATRNFSIVEGDIFSAFVRLIEKVTNTPIDLTNATCKMQVRSSVCLFQKIGTMPKLCGFTEFLL